mmetsp:Transcript_98007/g.299597  ORF Transcript_98007/g.299597 Transcript_98007/m.299597 type:complete len:776 (-) Transcript_98007:343-2670(-)
MAPYVLEGDGGGGGAEFVPAKPRALPPLDSAEGAGDDTRTPASVAEEEAAAASSANDGGIRPRPPDDPRPPDAGPKARQLQQSSVPGPREGESDVLDSTSGASTADTAQGSPMSDARTEDERSRSMKDKRMSHLELFSSTCSSPKGPKEFLVTTRGYMEFLYHQAEQLWLWKVMDGKAHDHAHGHEDGMLKIVRLEKDNLVLGDDEDDTAAEEEPAEAPTRKEAKMRRQSAYILSIKDQAAEAPVQPLTGSTEELGEQEDDADADERPPEATPEEEEIVEGDATAAGGGDPVPEMADAEERAVRRKSKSKKKQKELKDNPLKPFMTGKKVQRAQLQLMLESLPAKDLRRYLEMPLDPPMVPRALVVAVAANDPKLVDLLLEFKANVATPYEGTGFYKGWIKPSVSLVESVHNRKGRFVGTMLADRLEQIEASLLSALDRPEDEYISEMEPTASFVRQTSAEPDDVRAKAQATTVKRVSSQDPCGRTRVSVRIENSEFCVQHTQGHPRDVYEIMSLLGDGDSSTCWEGWHIRTRNPVAIKAECKSDEVMIWEEINMLRKIVHPNIVRLEETYENETQVFMVLELCEGGRLFDALQSKIGKDSHAKRLAHLMVQLATSVAYLHQKKICHRDIQLENFLLVKNDVPLEQAVVKLIDFTTAREFGPGKAEMTTKICTPMYVAREILSREMKPYTEKVDVWSLGVVYFIMCCGDSPFLGNTDFDTLKRVKRGAFKFHPEEVWASVPDEARDLISQMIIKPEDRLSAADVLMHPWLKTATG